MSHVIAHGYVGVTAPQLEEWRSLATEVLGMAVAAGSHDQQLRLRVDERAWRISVEPGNGGLAYCGWEVADATSLEALCTDLRAHGVEHRRDDGLAADRGVTELVAASDPAGNRLEFFWGANVPQRPFVSPTGARFVTADKSPGDMGFGHSVITMPDLDEAKHFYLDVLGFKLSDTIVLDLGHTSMTIYFTHVNPRHHSFAFVQGPPGPSLFDHFSLEVTDLDTVGRALDRVHERGIEIQQTLGKHTNDHMVSFYLKTPSGFMIEYGTGGRLIDETAWISSRYDAASTWGHEFLGAVPMP